MITDDENTLLRKIKKDILYRIRKIIIKASVNFFDYLSFIYILFLYSDLIINCNNLIVFITNINNLKRVFCFFAYIIASNNFYYIAHTTYLVTANGS